MSTSLIAMGVALFLVINLVVGLGILSLLFGTFDTFFGKPKLTVLRSTKNGNYFAFGFQWNPAKEPASMDTVKLRLFNPWGSPTQVELSQAFEGKRSSFALEANMGPAFIDFLGAKNFDLAIVQVEVLSSRDGVTFSFEMKGPKFRRMIEEANLTVDEFIKQNKLDSVKKSQSKIRAAFSLNKEKIVGRGKLTFGGGLTYLQLPAFLGNRFENDIFVEQSSSLGPHLQLGYTTPISSYWVWQTIAVYSQQLFYLSSERDDGNSFPWMSLNTRFLYFITKKEAIFTGVEYQSWDQKWSSDKSELSGFNLAIGLKTGF